MPLLSFDATARTYDKDGRLHINRSHISKVCVNPYYGREIPGADGLGLLPDKIYRLLRSPDELAKGAPTFARLPILSKHIPIATFDTLAEAEKKKWIAGTIGSDVEFLAPYLDADVSIWDATAIAGIETDKIREFSCAYSYVPIMSPGNYDGEPFDGIMTQIHGNHLALVEAGRAGSDVLAADSKLGEPMKVTKLGKALMVTLTTAFPKITIAQDSELGKMLAGARAKTFDKNAATKLVIAMDADIDSKKVEIVMDAMADMDKDEPEPKKEERAAEDEDEDDEPAMDCEECKAKDGKHAKDCKMGKDKKAKDARAARDKAAKDAEEKSEEKTKAAMDSLRKDLRDAEDARRDVRPVVGDVIAQDSAAGIYGFALDHLGVEHKGIEDLTALRALYKIASQKSATPVHIAMDSTTAEKTFPGLARIRKA